MTYTPGVNALRTIAEAIRYVNYAGYVEAKIEIDEMPFTFAQWWEIEQQIWGEQLTLQTDELGGGTDT